MKRLFSLLLAVALIVVLAVPVSAANESGWIELLEYSSVQANGENWFTMAASGSLTIPIQGEKRLRKIDLLIWNPTGQRFTSASCTMGGKTNTLDILAIGSNLTRIVGYLPDAFYEEVTLSLKKSTTSSQTYEVLSCKVSPVGVQEFVCDASVFIENGTYNIAETITINGPSSTHASSNLQIRVDIRDWRKYDSITVWGSADGIALNSIRATVSTSGLPITVNYFQYNDAGSWTEYVFETDPAHDYALETGASMSTPFYGKYLFCVTIDLSNTDRSLTNPIYVYLTGQYDTYYDAYFTCQYVNGQVFTADTSGMSWWNRFTSFMNELFGADDSSGALDDLGGSSDSITQDAADIHAFEQSQQAVLDSNFSAIQTAVTFTNFAAALTFVQRYSNMAFAGISDYSIVLTLPLFLGLFFYLCSRIPGVTRWRSRPPKGKGGGDP